MIGVRDMVQYDKKLLWHPRGDNKFIVGSGSQITLYEWTPDQPEIRQITSQHDLQHLKCFTWSPDPIFDDLVAVGNSSGRIELLRLEASKVSQRSNTLSSSQGISFNVRNSRSCNSLSFCSVDPNYLASGFDKVRGDCSLIIWDIHTASATLSIPLGQSSYHDTVKRPPRSEPIIPQADVGRGVDSRVLQQYASTETVTVVSFLPQSTTQLLAGISHRWLRLFDLRSPVATTLNVASKVQGIATDTFDPHRIACFGDNVITVWDTRKLQTPSLTFTEKDASADGAQLNANSVFSGLEFSRTRRGLLASMEREASYVRFWDILDINDDGPADGNKPRDPDRAGKKSWANIPWPSGASANYGPAPTRNQDTHGPILSDTRRTKSFSRPLSSFALAPSESQQYLTTNVMVVNREGDLELYAIYDTPKPATWSSRGNLTVAAGPSYRIIEAPDVPADMLQSSSSLFGRAIGTSGGGSRSREQSLLRGRQKATSGPVVPPPPDQNAPLSGRAVEEDFSALGSSGLSAMRLHGDYGTENGATKKVQGSALGLSFGRGSGGMASRNHSASRGRRTPGPKGVAQIVENDISMVMKRRAMRGYGLFDPRKNLDIVHMCDPPHHFRTQVLMELWAWIFHSYEYLCIPKPVLHGFDFSYQGLLGIWEGFKPLPVTQGPNLIATNNYYDLCEQWESHPSIDELYGNFPAALGALVGRTDRPWKPPVATSKALHRQVALQLIGWSFREDDFTKVLQGWEAEGELSKAACWLVFTRQHAKAISLLMKSSDESHCMLSGTIAALVPHGPKTTELREHCERLIVRVQDPYFRAILTHLALNDWSEVLEEEALPFRERLAIAFQFLDDKAVTSYLRRCQDHAILRGDLDAIIIPGLSNKAGMDILQGYVNRTGDVQSAAIMGSFVYPPRNPHQVRGISAMERRVERWVESYRDLLDGLKMFHCRVEFDIERGQIALKGGAVNVGDWVPRQIIIRCNYCNKPVIPDGPGGGIGAEVGGVQQQGRPTACFHCNRSLPRCSICLMTLSIVRDAAREAELLHTRSSKDTIEDAIVMCQTCRHGGHVSHIIDWFHGQDGSPGHDVCAVADCDCRCAEEI